MLEIILLIFLSKKIGTLAETKGLRPGPWKLRLILFWLGAEILGVVIGMMIFGQDNLISIMIVGLACAAGAYFIINSYLSKLPDTMNDDIENIGRN